MATPFFPEMVSPLARSDAAQWGTHIRRRNRKRSDARLRLFVAAAMRLLAARSSFDSLSVVVIVV
jgi:hypothetical protein